MKPSIDEFKSVKDKVEYVLKNFPDSRSGSPLATVLYVWKHCDGFDININSFLEADLSEIETIRRMRQKIQNTEGKYIPDLTELKTRDERQTEIKGFISKPEEEW